MLEGPMEADVRLIGFDFYWCGRWDLSRCRGFSLENVLPPKQHQSDNPKY